jgi:hypothetical protein
MTLTKILLQAAFLFLVLSFSAIHHNPVLAQVDLGLCPDGYQQGIVETGFVECYRNSGNRSNREDAEFDRLQREAVCLSVPNSEVTRSEILLTGSGQFYSSITCTITRQNPAGTVLCPDGADEIFRAFDTLVCQYFGSAANTRPAARTVLNENSAACSADAGGTVIDSRIFEADGLEPDTTFFYSNLSCAFAIPATDIFQCPVGFEINFQTEDVLECDRFDTGFGTFDAATSANANIQMICSSTTGGLGTVTENVVGADTSNNSFFSDITCLIDLPRYGEFRDGDIVRACDESCTEDLEQTRRCLNGGQVGGPGCSEADVQVITQACNTGTIVTTACPIKGVPSAQIVPLLILEEDEE